MNTQHLPNNAQLAQFGAEIQALYEARRQLAVKIGQIQDRLTSGYSKPLETHLNDLLKADMRLVCQITDQLT